MTVRSFPRLEMSERLTAHKLARPVWARFWRFRSARMAAPRSFEVPAGLMALPQFLRTTKFLAKCSKFARTQKSQGPLVAPGGGLLRDFDGVTGGDGTAFDDLAEHALTGHDAVAHLVVDGAVGVALLADLG